MSDLDNTNIFATGSSSYVKGSYILSGATLHIEKWNGDGDFGKWQWKMKAVLSGNNCHSVVYAPEELDPNTSAQELREMRQWALSRLQLAMGEDVIGQVSQETTAEGIWYKLEELYLKKSLTNRLILLKSILTYRMKDGSNMKNHMTVFDDLVMRLKAADLKLEEELLAMILLLSLPERYTGFANSLICGRDSITLSDVKTGILSEDLKNQLRGFSDDTSLGSSGSSHGLFVQRGFNGGEPGRKGKNRGRSNSRKPSSRSKSKGKDKCNYCHEEGHWFVIARN